MQKAIVCLMCVLALVMPERALHSSQTPLSGKIAFLRHRDTDTLCIADLATNDESCWLDHQVTALAFPAWSPDGQKIATVFDQDIVIVDATTHAIQDLALEGSCPVWSPDAKEIVFTSTGGLIRVLADGNNTVQTLYDKGNVSCPAWSPDGQTILFSSDNGTGGARTDIYTIEPDGSHLQQLTQNASNMLYYAFKYSPDGHQIAYLQRSSSSNDAPAMLIMTATGKKIHRINTAILDDAPGTFYSWSPDSKAIAYGALAKNGLANLHVLDISSGKDRVLTQQDIYAAAPAWSSDGTLIAFTTLSASLVPLIDVIDADGTNLHPLTTSTDADEMMPSWQPQAH